MTRSKNIHNYFCVHIIKKRLCNFFHHTIILLFVKCSVCVSNIKEVETFFVKSVKIS